MQKPELNARLATLSKRLDPLERFLEVFAQSLPVPFFYHSGFQHVGFRYGKPDLRHFCLLKGIRAVSALNASIVLVRAGYTQELYVLLRTVVEFKSHIEFVLSARGEDGALEAGVERHIQQYFSDFRRNSPEDYKRPKLRQGEVHESVGKMYTSDLNRSCNEKRFENVVPEKLLSNIYLNFSNYVHGRYPETMDLFGGEPPKFHLRGMSGTPKDDENFAMLEESIESISITLRILVQKLNLRGMVANEKELNVGFRRAKVRGASSLEVCYASPSLYPRRLCKDVLQPSPSRAPSETAYPYGLVSPRVCLLHVRVPGLGHPRLPQPTRRRRAMRQRARRLRGLEAAIRRRGEGQGRRCLGRLGADGDQLCQCDHRCRPRPAKLWSVARPVSRQARCGGHRRARAFAEAIAGRDVCVHSAALRRAAGPANCDLGDGDGFWQPARQSEHALVDRNPGLRLPPAGIFH